MENGVDPSADEEGEGEGMGTGMKNSILENN